MKLIVSYLFFKTHLHLLKVLFSLIFLLLSNLKQPEKNEENRLQHESWSAEDERNHHEINDDDENNRADSSSNEMNGSSKMNVNWKMKSKSKT